MDWVAPNTAEVCTITCTVNDGKEKATAAAQVNVTVEAPAVLGDWWCKSYWTSGDRYRSSFGPGLPWINWASNGKYYEYMRVCFNADGTFANLYRFCGEQEQRIDGTWSHDAARDEYVVDVEGGDLSTVTVDTTYDMDRLKVTDPDGDMYSDAYEVEFQRTENRFTCNRAEATGRYWLDSIVFHDSANEETRRVPSPVLSIYEDKATGRIELYRESVVGAREWWDGSYTRTESAIDAVNMTHNADGTHDLMDLHLIIDGPYLTGTAINHGDGWSAQADLTGGVKAK